MRRNPAPCLVLAAMLGAAGCLNGGDTSRAGSAAAPPAARSSEAADRTSSTRATGPGADVCSLLPASEVTEVTGLPIDRVEKKPDGCEWYASAAAHQQRGADTVRGTFAKLTKEEPKSAEDGVRSMQNMLKGMTSAASPDKPVFAVSIQWTDADRAEAMIKATIGVLSGGAPGGRLEPIRDLGDRAYAGPADVVFYVRKGAALLTFGSLGTREQAIALMRRVVQRIP
jgi:hypothetical protein